MKQHLTLLILLAACTLGWAQDIIVKHNGTKIEAKVIEVGARELQYKDWNKPKGPIRVMKLEEVHQIRYANGNIDEFVKRITSADTIVDRYGNKYIGELIEGRKEGFGIQISADGTRYEGNFLDNMRSGQGIQIYENGNRYEGEWKNDMANGLGRYIGSNGNSYDGAWKNNHRHGYGIATYSDGNRYEGEWSDNARHGRGVFYFASGDRYEGDFINNQMTGRGTYYWHDGNRYEGDFKNGASDGYGILYYANGNRYAGEWKDDSQHGMGTMYYANGQIKEGLWRNDLLVKSMPVDHSRDSISQPQGNPVENIPVRLSQVQVAVQPTQQPAAPAPAEPVVKTIEPAKVEDPTPAATKEAAEEDIKKQEALEKAIDAIAQPIVYVSEPAQQPTAPAPAEPQEPTPARTAATSEATLDETRVDIAYYNYTDFNGDDMNMQFASSGVFKEFILRFRLNPAKCIVALYEVDRNNNDAETFVEEFSFIPTTSHLLDQGAMLTISFDSRSGQKALVIDRSEHVIRIDNNYRSGKSPIDYRQFDTPGPALQASIDEFNAITAFPHTQAGEPNYDAKFITLMQVLKTFNWQ